MATDCTELQQYTNKPTLETLIRMAREIRPEAIQATLQEISRTDPRALKVSAQQLIDRRFLEEMEKDGTFDRLGMK
jgi:hypothetical protein